MTSKKKRAINVLQFAICIVALGLLYAIWCHFSALHIPCLFHHITGWYCPGCGVTRMCLAILSLDFDTAFYYNKAIFILLPFYILIGIKYILLYIKIGKISFTQIEKIGLIISIVILLVYGLIRNILPYNYF